MLYGPIIGGSVGGVLGLTLVTVVIIIIITYCKCRKSRYKTWKGEVRYTQGQYGTTEKVKLVTLYILVVMYVCMLWVVYRPSHVRMRPSIYTKSLGHYY